jgi:hypothetical protein
VGERVAHEVADDLPQPDLVADDEKGRPGPDGQVDVPAGRDDPRVVYRVGREGQQVDGAGVERPLLVEPREQQHVFDEHAHPGSLLLDPAHDPVQVGRRKLTSAAPA